MKMNLKIKKKKYSFWVLLALLVLSSFFIGNFANAVLGNAVSGIIGHIVQFLVWILGGILFVLIYILVWIAQYNDFIHSGAVTNGWVIVRDLCNMFFILILLIIAFATILRIENYNAKKLLPKLLIMAVLINFSKTICGLIIDFAQVIMLTFVNGFKDMGSANLTSMLGIENILAIKADASDVSLLSIVGSYFLALIYTIISVIVVLVIVAVLVMRIIMLWVYIVLSPLAFLLSAFPAGQKYASQWWSEFSKQVVVGPILAFFIWLSFVSIGTNNAGTILNTPKPGDTDNTTKLSSQPVAGVAKAGTPDDMIKFIIAIGMLVGGLMVTQQLGGAAGSIAGKGMAAIQKGRGLAWKGAVGGMDFLNRKQALKTGIDLSPTRQIARVKAGLESMKKEDFRGIQAKSTSNLRRGGLIGGVTGITATDWTENYLKGFLGARGWKQVFQGGKKSVNRLRENQELSSWKADNVSDEVGFNQKRRKLDIERYSAMKIGDKDTARDKEEEIQKLDKYKKELVSPLEAQRVALKNKYNKESLGFGEKADRLTIQDYEGKAELKAAVAEQGKKIDSTNEDELIADFQKAMSHNNVNLAAAIAKALVRCGGFNTLLGKHGYNPKAGLTESEIKQLKDTGRESEIKDKVGVNDFMRDIFQKRLGINKHDSLTLQSDLGGLAESTSHAYLTKTVGVNSGGEFYQSKEAEREAAVNIEHRKKESEGWARKESRLYYGGENVYTKNFEWSKSGLTKVIDGLSIISKEIALKRFNSSSAKAFIEPGSLKILKKAIESAAASGVISNDSFHKDFQGKNVDESVNKFLQALENHAKTLKKDNADAIKEIVNKNIV